MHLELVSNTKIVEYSCLLPAFLTTLSNQSALSLVLFLSDAFSTIVICETDHTRFLIERKRTALLIR
ncbi:hypothetical protein Y032_0018g3530 [Ancylostoma ceylanicum]|uniref:Uncharacterized protein n=1 Tax=Ancylostoma ceylanicum TaxID=53326 RepID=A0A016V445_9BILA|nr:hypothetical protein Y032_0018g3530 [Ancylostoma ceylanicum]